MARPETTKRYYYYKEHGICVVCGQYDAVPGKTMCEVCAAKNCEKNEKYQLSPGQKKRYAEHARKKRASRKAKGLCIQCGKPQAEGSSFCNSCLARKRNDARERSAEKRGNGLDRSELPDYGICYICCKNPVEDGWGTCTGCHAQLAERLRINREKRDKSRHPWKKRAGGIR